MSPPDFPKKPRPAGARRRSPSDLASGAAPVSHGYVKSFDGTKLFYTTEGEGKPLIFCYGLVCSSLHWTYQIDHFSKNYQTVWFDYRGHQNSETPKNMNSLTLENMARDLGIILDELKIDDAILLGHSMGVNVVLEFYRQQPKRVAGMVLANGTPKRPLETIFRNNTLQGAFKMLKAIYARSPELVQTFWKLGKGNPIARAMITLGGFNPHLTPQADIELYVDQVSEMDPAILIHLIENYESCDAVPWLHTVKAPTLIVAGEEDKITPIEQQELMHQLIPGSQLEIIRHGSHCPQMDLPDLVNHKIADFLERLNYATTPTPTTESASRSTGKRPNPRSLTLS
jgi:pimeloyl-ACP methyl ester carboxylesterase